jgi:hypothetical protein
MVAYLTFKGSYNLSSGQINNYTYIHTLQALPMGRSLLPLVKAAQPILISKQHNAEPYNNADIKLYR